MAAPPAAPPPPSAAAPGSYTLSQLEWEAMESALEPETAATHRNIGMWLRGIAEKAGIKKQADDSEDEDSDDDPASPTEVADEGAATADVKKRQEEKNWSTVRLLGMESKLKFRGYFSEIAFTNWVWAACVRPRLEEAKGKVPTDIPTGVDAEGIEEVENLMGEYVPKSDKKEKKKDKEDKKDKKKDKKEEKEEKKKEKKKRDKKMEVSFNKTEQMQVAHFVRNMLFGIDAKKGQTAGWIGPIAGERDVPTSVPWEFQLAHVLSRVLHMEYRCRKKKEVPETLAFYDEVQSLADALAAVRRQMRLRFGADALPKLLPLVDAATVLNRVTQETTAGVKFDLHWYLKNCAHLLSGSHFSKRHAGRTEFMPFVIQELTSQALLRPGPQMVFSISPPGTGKTAIVPHLLNLFPDNSLVFVCAALPVVLSVGQIAHSLGIPYAFVKEYYVTPSYSCGRGIGKYNSTEQQTAVQRIKEFIDDFNKNRKAKRLAEKKKKRKDIDFKRMPKLYLVRDVQMAPWILRQLDKEKTVLVVDEPPMGADEVPEKPEDNQVAKAMMETLTLPTWKTLLTSATLPRPEQLPTVVETFSNIFKVSKDTNVSTCFSTQLDRGVILVRPNGKIAFPHELCKTAAELRSLCDRLPTDPLVLKAYTERALAAILSIWASLPNKEALKVPPPEERFADISNLKHDAIREYVVDILRAVADTGDDKIVQAFCQPEDHKAQFPSFDLENLLFKNAAAFPGTTLVADSDPRATCRRMAKPLVDCGNLGAEEKTVEREEKPDARRQMEEEDEPETVLKFDKSIIIGTPEFMKRWCPNSTEKPTIPRILPTISDYRRIQKLPVDDDWRNLALTGMGAYDPSLDKDPKNPLYTQWVHDAMQKGKLACVCAGKEFTWGANIPASTVAVTKSFAGATSVAGILQYIGRAARRGLTTHGQAIFESDADLDRVFMKGAQQMSTEADTMERYAKWWKGGCVDEAWSAAATDAC